MAESASRVERPISRTEWLTVRDIAVLLHVREGTVRRWIRRERLDARFFGGRTGYRVKEGDLEDFLRQKSAGRDDPPRTDRLPMFAG
jgi:excisionase family DNA binding protein